MLPSVIGSIGSSKRGIVEHRFLIKNISIVGNLAYPAGAGSHSINPAGIEQELVRRTLLSGKPSGTVFSSRQKYLNCEQFCTDG
jgi:hypothetical protein